MSLWKANILGVPLPQCFLMKACINIQFFHDTIFSLASFLSSDRLCTWLSLHLQALHNGASESDKCTVCTSEPGDWGFLSMYWNNCRECNGAWARLFSAASSDRAGANGHKLKQRRFPLSNWKCCSTVRVTEHSHRLLREVVESPSSGILRNCWTHCPGQVPLSDPAWAGSLNQMTSRGPFQPQSFLLHWKLWIFFSYFL